MKRLGFVAALVAAGVVFLGWKAKKAAEKVVFADGGAWEQVETQDEPICEPRDFFGAPEGFNPETSVGLFGERR